MIRNFHHTVLFAGLALLAFAANSVLTRLAIGTEAIDATSFTVIRLFAGSIALLGLATARSNGVKILRQGSWIGALTLFTYAAAFSFAYIQLDTGLGALILFGTVQLTLVTIGLIGGERMSLGGWLGVLLAFAGLAYLLWDRQSTQSVSLLGFSLMSLAGLAWGVYTFVGKQSENPLTDTAGNFLRALPFCVLLTATLLYQPVTLSIHGVTLAIVAGAVTSGIGYAIWYRALPKLKSIQAGVLQLSVPLIAAFGGVIFVGESITQKLLIAMFLVIVDVPRRARCCDFIRVQLLSSHTQVLAFDMGSVGNNHGGVVCCQRGDDL